MQRYIGDDVVTICLQGLRYIRKADSMMGGGDHFYLEAGYKGKDISVKYRNEKARDELYSKIKAELTEKDIPRGPVPRGQG